MGVNSDGTPRRIDGGNHGESGGPAPRRQEDQPLSGNVRGAENFAESTTGIGGTVQGGNGFGLIQNIKLKPAYFQLKPPRNWKY